MDLAKVERLLELVARSGMAEVEVEEEGFRLFVRAAAPAAPTPPMMMAAPPSVPAPMPGGAPAPEAAAAAPPAAPAEPGKGANEQVVQAPIVGTFYASPAPDADPFVQVGDRVEVGTVLCIIEAMKLMNEIQSEHAGLVRQVLVQNAQPVEYDQPLFVIEEG